MTVVNEAHVMAWMTVSAQAGSANRKGYYAISINGVDSPVLTRNFSNSGARAVTGVTFRTATELTPGTYTVKARWYTDSGTTLSGDIHLASMVLETGLGLPLESTYKTNTGITTSSTTYVDMTGIIDNTMSTPSPQHIFGFIGMFLNFCLLFFIIVQFYIMINLGQNMIEFYFLVEI
jgi:hypothetical protein